MIVVNIIGGPGAGKSTMAARVFSELKELGYTAELVTEFAKDMVWQDSMKVLDNQMYVFAKQHHRIWRLKDRVDIVVTDSPILLSLIYGTTSETFKKLVVEEFNSFDNIVIRLNRVKKYNPKGRYQTEDEAKDLDKTINDMMDANDIKTDMFINGEKDSTTHIVKLIVDTYANAKCNKE